MVPVLCFLFLTCWIVPTSRWNNRIVLLMTMLWQTGFIRQNTYSQSTSVGAWHKRTSTLLTGRPTAIDSVPPMSNSIHLMKATNNVGRWRDGDIFSDIIVSEKRLSMLLRRISSGPEKVLKPILATGIWPHVFGVG
jgi:hypothetical protein